MTISWTRRPSDAWGGLGQAYVAAIRNGVRRLAEFYAPEIEAYLKSSATWTDRTGNARQTLHTEVEQAGMDMVTILLAHGVEYGIWLELAMASRFAVIAPAIDIYGPRLWADVQALLR